MVVNMKSIIELGFRADELSQEERNLISGSPPPTHRLVKRLRPSTPEARRRAVPRRPRVWSSDLKIYPGRRWGTRT